MSVGPHILVGVSLALYRRYRPESFAEVIGQEHVTDPLQQALRNNRVNHAYLFSGPRGCGKTTSARILARCLNCVQGPTPTPCGECQSCQDLARNGPGSIDVIEIDAASHGGVDDARDLREKAFFGPAGSRYKIYIIDEAHMVTPQGFNALLKVVEEPPEHLKFIFATTEPEKVIGTIRSRTHHYPFRLVPPGTLRDYLAEVCAREDIPVEDGVYPLVVRSGAGSVRDSMSVMDQLLAGAGADGVTYAMATALLGYTDAALLDEVVDAFAAGDGAAVFEMVDRVIEGGHDPRRFVADLLERLRDLVIIAAVPDAVDKGLIDAPSDVVERMRAQTSVFGAAELSRAADLVNTGLTEMRGATSPRLQLELICARVLLPAAYDDERSVQARLDKLERRGFAPGAPQVPDFAYQPAHADHAPAPASGGPGGAASVRAAVGGGGGTGGGRPVATPQPAPEQREPSTGPSPAAAAVPAPSDGGARQRPGAWPTTAAPAAPAAEPAAPAEAARPGAWPTSAPAAAATPAAAPAVRTPPPAGPAAPAASGFAGDSTRVRQMWPDILEAVKNRRRLTWMLLLNNAQVAGFDGQTLQLGFDNPGARNSFANSGSEDVLKQAIVDALGVEWRIEAIVDPSGGGGTSGGPGGGFGGTGGGSGGGTGGGTGGGGSRPPAPAAPPAPSAPAPPAQPAPSTSSDPQGGPVQQASYAAPQAAPGRPQGPPPLMSDETPPPLEDDIPEDDDVDLVESPLSGYELFVREMGATVIQEIPND
ncbi:DNA polymerase III subunit gamma and tau [Streptomyces sp. H39-S7]|uniref:DNA polymerase III subunit gamma and tau n=1 Tax=Streptomyces sp. H39-S7 TaxID=3004357 RepID=UPI0022B078CD|nr:DNA polymerase III subunit gamma and tau [Streptomyces sp. H39-S7]MCZ4123904.1 DNA polymerase III subunit gamma and tau [Streptomyces sp. H39-S7]